MRRSSGSWTALESICTPPSTTSRAASFGWSVEDRLNPLATLEILSTAGGNYLSAAESSKESAAQPSSENRSTNVVMDAGVENVNRTVDGFFDLGQLRRVLVQVDVTFSNSPIEAWWNSLKHQGLYLHQLDSITTVRRLVAFYVQQHNVVMSHSVFNGLTLDEVYFGKTTGVLPALAEQRASARGERHNANQAATCPACPRAPPAIETEGARQPSERSQMKVAARRFAPLSSKCSAAQQWSAS